MLKEKLINNGTVFVIEIVSTIETIFFFFQAQNIPDTRPQY
jgi:hypothetical protein